jgi:hypothetical protein
MEVCALKNALVSKGEKLHLHSPQEEDSEGDAKVMHRQRGKHMEHRENSFHQKEE